MYPYFSNDFSVEKVTMADFKTAIHEQVTANKDAMLDFWKTLVNHESGSSDLEGLKLARDFIVNFCKELGATVETTSYEKAGDLIVATWNGDIDAAPIVLSGHYDTVFKRGTIKERPFTIKDGIAYGPGVLDMRAGITMALFSIKILLGLGYKERPLKLVLAGDEEVGHQFSTAAADLQKAVTGAKAAFNFETGYTDNGIVVGRKGCARALIRVKGIGAHAGNEPEKGRSAVVELANKIIDIESRNRYEEGITYTVGVIQGGSVYNAVPENASMMVDIRFRQTDQLDVVKKDLAEVLSKTHVEGTTTTMDFSMSIIPMETTPEVLTLFDLYKTVAKELGYGEFTSKVIGGGADSAYEVAAGVPTICAVGAAGEKNHTVKEFAVVDSIYTRTEIVLNTIVRLS